MISCQSDIPVPFDAETGQQPDIGQNRAQLPSKGIKGISALTVGLVSATLVLPGCAQLKPKPEHCRCSPPPSKQSSCDVTDKKLKEKFLKIALKLHEIHTEAMELANELDLFEKAGDEDKEAKKEAQKRKPEIKGKLIKLLLVLRKYKEVVLKNSELNSRIIFVEDYLKRRMKDHFGN